MQALEEKLWQRIRINRKGCWLWIGRIHKDGYGKWCENGKEVLAHRLMYELQHGEIPSAMEIDHLCKKRNCVNPDHLEVVPHAENVRRGNAGAHWLAKTHCPRGHPYSGANLILRGTQGGKRTTGRICRACTNAAYARRKAKLSQ